MKLEQAIDKERLSHRKKTRSLASTDRSNCYEIVRLNPDIRIFSESDLRVTQKQLGSGQFGSCSLCYLAQLKVCAKSLFNTEYSKFCYESNILSQFCHPNVAFFVGICQKPHLILTLFHGFDEQSFTLFSFISNPELSTQYKVEWKKVVHELTSGLIHIHSKNILHNDLKCDNVILGFTRSCEVSAVIVDFGKSCYMSHAKRYNLSKKQIEEYKQHHPQIAPDLREGHCKQSPASDAYSLGRIMKCLLKMNFIKVDISSIVDKCLLFHACQRPSVQEIQAFFNGTDKK